MESSRFEETGILSKALVVNVLNYKQHNTDYIECAELLISKGANVDVEKDSTTLLMESC